MPPTEPFVARRLPLRGADLVLLALGSTGASSNNALLVVHCDGLVATERVRRSVERLLDVCPWPAARLRRPVPWGKLHWAAGRRSSLAPPPVHHRTVTTSEAFHEAVATELNTAIDATCEAPVRFLILDQASTVGTCSALVMTWFHPFMDPRGAQNLLQHLAYLDSHPGETPWGTALPVFTSTPDARPFAERGRLARKSLAYMRRVSPARAAPSALHTGPVRFRQESFVERDRGMSDDRSTRDIGWRVAVVARALREIRARRGVPEGPFVLPIAVDLRPKGEPGPSFGNMLAFHFARFESADTADVPGLARALRTQMADALREGQIEANEVAMSFLQYRPLWMLRRDVRSSSGGDAFSFNCADVADFPVALARCFGLRVENAYHVPAVPPRPGIGVFFNRCAGLNNLVVAWIAGALSDDDVTRIVDIIREELGWRRAP